MASNTIEVTLGVIAAQYGGISASVPANTALKFTTKSIDTTGTLYSPATGAFTVPVGGDGIYNFSTTVEASGSGNIYLDKNGSNMGYLITTTAGLFSSGDIITQCVAGDTLSVFTDTTLTFGGGFVSIYKIPGSQ